MPRPTILVADDEFVVADTLALILNRHGYAATAVYSGEDAVEAAVRLKPDMLVSDIHMEKMSGIEAAIRIRQTVPGCRVILCTGHPAALDQLREANHHGHGFEFLIKPFHPTVLIKQLKGPG